MTTDNAAGGTPRIENPSRLVGRLREATFPLNDQGLIRSTAFCIERLASEFDHHERDLSQAKHDLAREVTIAAHECAERVRLQGELAQVRDVALEEARAANRKVCAQMNNNGFVLEGPAGIFMRVDAAIRALKAAPAAQVNAVAQASEQSHFARGQENKPSSSAPEAPDDPVAAYSSLCGIPTVKLMPREREAIRARSPGRAY